LRRCKRLLVEIYQVLRHDTQYIPTGLGYIPLTDAASTSRRRVRAIPEHHPSRPRRVAPAADTEYPWLVVRPGAPSGAVSGRTGAGSPSVERGR
jgi:hypothetical protein